MKSYLGGSLVFGLSALSLSAAVQVINIQSVYAFHQGDSLAGTGSAVQVINGAGLTKTNPNDISTWTHDSTWQAGWQGQRAGSTTTTANPVGWLVFDFGSSQTQLGSLYLWNSNESGGTPPSVDRGVNQYRIWYSDAPTAAPPATSATVNSYDFSANGWTVLGSDRTLAKAGGTATESYSGVVDISGIASARYIGLELISNHGGYHAGANQYRIGLAEVVVTQIPEPSSAAMMLCAILGLQFRRRK